MQRSRQVSAPSNASNLGRRTFIIGAGTWAGASLTTGIAIAAPALGGASSAAAAGASPLGTRRLGSVEVSSIGYGAMSSANIYGPVPQRQDVCG